MDIRIRNGCKTYEFNLEKLTQILGYNFKTKEYIIDSIIKHFSTYKYNDYDENMIENISIDDNVPGRKEYNCIYIKDRESLYEYIKLTKNSLLLKFINSFIRNLDCQKNLCNIDDSLTNIYTKINNKLNENIPFINVDYSFEDILSIVSKSDVITNDDKEIQSLTNLQLLIILYGLINENNKIEREKYIVIIKNIDHLCDNNEYRKIVEKILLLDDNVFTITSISVNNYVYIDNEVSNGIVVLNDTIFQLPGLERVEDYINNHYPIEMNYDSENIVLFLKSILNYVGIDGFSMISKDYLILKLLNRAICINDKYDFSLNNAERACLQSK